MLLQPIVTNVILCTSVNFIVTNYLLSEDDTSPGPSKRPKLSTTTPGPTSELANRYSLCEW